MVRVLMLAVILVMARNTDSSVVAVTLAYLSVPNSPLPSHLSICLPARSSTEGWPACRTPDGCG